MHFDRIGESVVEGSCQPEVVGVSAEAAVLYGVQKG